MTTHLGIAMAAAAAALLSLSCGGGGGDTAPVSVAAVAITSPAAPPTFGALARTVTFGAEAQDAAGAPVGGAILTWSTSDAAVATVSATGVVTAAGNGTAQIRAASGGRQSAPLAVTVAQVAAQVVATPASIVFGALGATRQIAAAVSDSTAHAIPGQTVTWSRAGPGTTATVSATGLASAVAVGAADTAVATAGAMTVRVPISVTQVPATIAVTSISATPDTLRTTGRTRQFSAAVRDTNGNAIAGAAVTWSSGATSVATVGAAGLVTAVGDGSATITAASLGAQGTRAMVVQRFAAAFTHTPASASITTSGGTAAVTASAQDSAATALSISFASRNTAVFTVSPAAGTGTTATAAGDGSAFLVMTVGSRSDSARVTVSGQVAAVSFASSIQPIFTANCASCHDGSSSGTLPASMNLRSGFAYGSIVGVASIQTPSLSRVSAGSVLNSYLARKLDPTVGAISGGQMPAGGSLTAQQIQLIKTWITQGALNN